MLSAKPVTEVASIMAKAGLDLSDKRSAARQTWNGVLAIISSQDGFQNAYWGPVMEDPAMYQLCVDWKSLESHEMFMQSPQYVLVVNALGSIALAPPSLFHFQPDPYPPSVFGTALVVEVATFYKTESYFLENVKQFVRDTKDAMDGGMGCVLGPVVEQIEKDPGAGTGKAVLLCLGWESKEAHMKYRETDSFSQNIGLLREGCSAAEMHHTIFEKY